MSQRTTIAHNVPMATVPRSRYGRAGVAPQEGYPYYWRVRTVLPERYGQRCRVTARGKLNSRRVEFEDGFWVITLGNYIRRVAAREQRQHRGDDDVQRERHGGIND